jgi:hypothetical protein
VQHLAPFELGVGNGLVAFALGPIGAGVLNWIQGKRALIEEYDNGFLRLADEAIGTEQPLVITLKDRKVYVCYVV